MSEAIAFDTHRYVKSLTGCGFTETQAETLAEGQVALLNSNLAAKADVEALRQETKVEFAKVGADVEALRQETKVEFAKVGADVEALRQETKAEIAKVGADVDALRQETKAEIARVEAGIEALRQETKTEIATLKAELVRWMFGGMVAMTGIFAAIVGFMVPGG